MQQAFEAKLQTFGEENESETIYVQRKADYKIILSHK